MQKKLIKIANDTNIFLKNFIKKQKKNRITYSNEIWAIPRREKNKIKNLN